MRKLLYTILGLGFSLAISAQDIHFSQFYMSPLNLNPAMTGVMNCNTRMVANYRNQWASVLGSDAYNTYSVSYDQKIPVGRSDYFGIGGSFFGDVAGATRFGTVLGRLSLAYSKKMGGYRKKSHYLSIGADVGLGQRAIRGNVLKWPSQSDGQGGFDPNLPGGVINNPDFLYGDISAGLIWFSNIDDKTNWYMGLTMAHLNQPNISFSNQIVSLYSRFTIHGGGMMEIAPGISVIPNVVAMFQGPHREYNLGSSLRFAIGNQRVVTQSWQLGLWYRLGSKAEYSVPSNEPGGQPTIEGGGLHSDALIFATRFDYETYGLGFSYDYNISKLQEGGSFNGAFEFSLVYYICGSEKRAVYCPRF